MHRVHCLRAECCLCNAMPLCEFEVHLWQTCIMGSRLLVHESIAEEVIAKFVAKASGIKVGAPQDITTQMGPVISAAQLQKVESFVDMAKREGAKVLCGGGRPAGLAPELKHGHFYAPTVRPLWLCCARQPARRASHSFDRLMEGGGGCYIAPQLVLMPSCPRVTSPAWLVPC